MAIAYNIANAALQMGLSKSLLYELIRQGKIAAVQITPDKRVIRTAEIERYLEANERKICT